MAKLKVLDLFSGIGGFSLGLERTGGFETIAFCEIEPFCQKVLKKHWPDVPVYDDITKFSRRIYDCEPENEDGEVICPRCKTEFGECQCIGTDQFLDEIGQPDVICGGFPCQDISLLGKGKGLAGTRSGLWFEYLRIIGELEPKWVLIENVSALLHRGLPAILYGLNEIGYNAQWHVISASGVGAPHLRKRIWIIANPISERLPGHSRDGKTKGKAKQNRSISPENLFRGKNPSQWWESEPEICRVDNGISDFVDRTKAIGNAIVPQIPEIIGYAILEAEKING